MAYNVRNNFVFAIIVVNVAIPVFAFQAVNSTGANYNIYLFEIFAGLGIADIFFAILTGYKKMWLMMATCIAFVFVNMLLIVSGSG